jgi:RHS repeat-associated protein
MPSVKEAILIAFVGLIAACAETVDVNAAAETPSETPSGARDENVAPTDELEASPTPQAAEIEDGLPTEDADTQTVGTLAGALRVTDDGVATYRIPMRLPIGHASVQPSLAVRYSSSAANGLLGVGFSLEGFSTIQRCGRTMVPDGVLASVQLDDQDNLCLDGARLELIEGTPFSEGAVYRPERDTFVRVRQVGEGDEAYFLADQPSGNRIRYGGTDDSTLLTRGVASGWAVARVEDDFGNYVTYSYAYALDETVADGADASASTVEHRPEAISLWGSTGRTPRKAITFHYDLRHDRLVGHVNGGIRNVSYQLSRIELRDPDDLHYRDYNFYYLQSQSTTRTLLTFVVECSAINASCLPGTEFEWSHAAEIPFNDDPNDVGLGFVGEPWPNVWSQGENGGIPVNANGDFEDDLVLVDPISDTWQVWNGGVNGDRVDTGIVTKNNLNLWSPQRFRGHVDNDGAEDLLVLDAHFEPSDIHEWSDPAYLTMLMGGKEGFTEVHSGLGDGQELDVPFMHPEYPYSQMTAADFNADGLLDLAICHAVEAEPDTTAWSFYYADGDRGWIREDTPSHEQCTYDDFTTVDYDGDHGANLLLLRHPSGDLPDLQAFPDEEYVALVKGPDGEWADRPTGLPGGVLARLAAWEFGSYGGGRSTDVIADLNGDGLGDVVRFEPADGDTVDNSAPLAHGVDTLGVFVAFMNTGGGFRRSVRLWPEPDAQLLRMQTLTTSIVVDADLDGTQELMVMPPPDTATWLALGLRSPFGSEDEFEPIVIDTNVFYYWDPEGPLGIPLIGPFDWDGDGLQDFLARDYDEHIVAFERQGERPDLLVGITDGYGATTSVEYAPLRWVHSTDPSACDYPVQCVNDARPVVKYETHDLGTDHQHTSQRLQHAYADGRSDRLGRGWLGFAEHGFVPIDEDPAPVLTRVQMDNQTYDSEIQDYPLAHKRARVIRESSVVGGFRQITDVVTTSEARRGPEGLTWFTVPIEERTRSVEYSDPDDCAPSYRFCMVDAEDLDDIPAYAESTKSFEHDEFGNVTALRATDQRNNLDEVEKDYQNSTVDPWYLGRVTLRVERSTVGESVRERRSEFRYEHGNGALKSSTVEPGSPELELQTVLFRDQYGNVWSNIASDATGKSRSVVTAFDELGVFPRNQVNALGHLEQTVYSYRSGAIRRHVDPNGAVTDYTYDSADRRVRAERFGGLQGVAEGVVETTTYERAVPGLWFAPTTMNIVQSTPGHSYFAVEQDRLGRSVRSVTKDVEGNDIEQRTQYDAAGLLASTSLATPVGTPSPGETIYEYDALRRMLRKRAPDGSETKFAYTSALVRNVTDPGGRVTTFAEDARGRVIRTVDPAGTASCFGYGPFGALVSVRRGCAVSPAFWTIASFDAYGRRVVRMDPDRGLQVSKYNAFGELSLSSDAGVETTYEYDAMGRTTLRTDSDGTTEWVWDLSYGVGTFGTVLKDRSPDGVVTGYVHDVFGRETRRDRTLDGHSASVTTTYDNLGRPAVVEFPDSFGVPFALERIFDDVGHLVEVRDRDTLSTFWRLEETHPSGMPEQEQFGNGLLTSRVYDALSLMPSSIVTSAVLGGFDVQGLAYEFNPDRTLSFRGDATGPQAETFSYDAVGRLDVARAERFGVTFAVDHNYDAFGNLTYRSGIGKYVYDDAARPDRLTKVGGKILEYDARGNITDRDEGELQIVYTAFDVPRSVTAGGSVTTFAYDAAGARAERNAPDGTTTHYLGDYELRTWGLLNSEEHRYGIRVGARAVAEVVRSNAAEAGDPGSEEYVEKTRYFHDDHLGSLDVVTDEVGAVVQRVSFESFGRPRDPIWTVATAPPPIATPVAGFTGVRGAMDGGLVPMPGRWYDPWSARFLGPDPLIVDPYTPLGQNRYAYAWNRPLSVTDPSGLAPPSGEEVDDGMAPIYREVVVPANNGGGWGDATWTSIEHGLDYAWDRIGDAVSDARGGQGALSVADVVLVEAFALGTQALDGVNDFYSGVGDGVIPGLDYVREAAVPGVTNYESDLYGAGKVAGIAASLAVPVAQSALMLKTAAAIVASERAVQAAAAVAQTARLAGARGVVATAPRAVGPAVARGGAAPVAAGKRGEAAVRAVADIGVKEKIVVGGRIRIPDGLTVDVLSEVKNVTRQSYTQQLRDFAAHARDRGLRFDLWVREDATLSARLWQEVNSGAINLRRFSVP